MKTILVAINAKFIHSNLAVRYLKKYAEQHGQEGIDFKEYTINQSLDYILSEIYEENPDVIGFSSYIWNINYVKKLCIELRKLMPQIKIFLGGPEVSFDHEILREIGADYLIYGEGEKSFSALIDAITNKSSISKVNGISYLKDGEVVTNPPATALELDELPFPYDDVAEFKDRIIYYETMRGCPYNCGYCLSSVEKGVRFKTLDKVYTELQFFLENNIRQVKFVDRTFNCNKLHCIAIVEYLKKHDNQETNFHFEIAAENVSDEFISAVKDARHGLFQFEIGVQSTNAETLTAIDRKSEFAHLKDVVAKLQKSKNIHLHLDLIAGLPFEGIDTFEKSFNDVHSMKPDQLQLGFLKLLKGSMLHREKEQFGIVSREYPPYEVLFTSNITATEMIKLKKIEDMVETFYNSNRFKLTVDFLAKGERSPFEFYSKLAEFYYSKGLHHRPHSKTDYYNILHDFYQTKNPSPTESESLKWLMKFDIYSHEKAKKLPDFYENQNDYHEVKKFLKQNEDIVKYLSQYINLPINSLMKRVHVEFFPFNPITGEDGSVTIVWNYNKTDILGNTEYIIL